MEPLSNLFGTIVARFQASEARFHGRQAIVDYPWSRLRRTPVKTRQGASGDFTLHLDPHQDSLAIGALFDIPLDLGLDIRPRDGKSDTSGLRIVVDRFEDCYEVASHPLEHFRVKSLLDGLLVSRPLRQLLASFAVEAWLNDDGVEIRTGVVTTDRDREELLGRLETLLEAIDRAHELVPESSELATHEVPWRKLAQQEQWPLTRTPLGIRAQLPNGQLRAYVAKRNGTIKHDGYEFMVRFSQPLGLGLLVEPRESEGSWPLDLLERQQCRVGSRIDLPRLRRAYSYGVGDPDFDRCFVVRSKYRRATAMLLTASVCRGLFELYRDVGPVILTDELLVTHHTRLEHPNWGPRMVVPIAELASCLEESRSRERNGPYR